MFISYYGKYLEFDLQSGTMSVKTFLKVETERSEATKAAVWQEFLEFTELVAERKH